jgi:hypothetical protein
MDSVSLTGSPGHPDPARRRGQIFKGLLANVNRTKTEIEVDRG